MKKSILSAAAIGLTAMLTGAVSNEPAKNAGTEPATIEQRATERPQTPKPETARRNDTSVASNRSGYSRRGFYLAGHASRGFIASHHRGKYFAGGSGRRNKITLSKRTKRKHRR